MMTLQASWLLNSNDYTKTSGSVGCLRKYIQLPPWWTKQTKYLQNSRAITFGTVTIQFLALACIDFIQFSSKVSPSSLFPRVAQKSTSAERSLLPLMARKVVSQVKQKELSHLVAQKSPTSAVTLFFLSSRSSSLSSMSMMNVSSSGSRMLRLRTPNIGGIFHLIHLIWLRTKYNST